MRCLALKRLTFSQFLAEKKEKRIKWADQVMVMDSNEAAEKRAGKGDRRVYERDRIREKELLQKAM